MALFVTLPQAKAHMRITTPPGHVDDPDLLLKLDAAEGFITRYVGRSAAGAALVTLWALDPPAVPPDVQHAILIMFAEFNRFRGDDPAGGVGGAPRDPGADVPPVVAGLLRRYGDPVLR